MLWGLLLSLLLTAVSLAMDAFAVSVCDGMVYRDMTRRKGVIIPVTFALFQTLMPITGFYIGLVFRQFSFFDAIAPWIGFVLLLIIGGKMVYDGVKDYRAEEEAETKLKTFSIPTILLQGVATSIDALFVGFTFNVLLDVECVTNIQLWAWIAVAIIGVVTFVLSLVGLLIGNRFGKLFRKKACVAEIIGGVVLVLLGVKMLLAGYGVINF